MSIDLLTNSSLDTQDGSLHNMLNKFFKMNFAKLISHTNSLYEFINIEKDGFNIIQLYRRICIAYSQYNCTDTTVLHYSRY